MNSANMLNPMWIRLTWRKPAVTIRHQSPSATAGPLSPASRTSVPPPENEPRLAPPASSATKAATLIAISA